MKSFKIGFVGGAGLLMLAVATIGCTRVNPGNVGIQVNLSGTGRGVSEYPVVTGRVWYNPYTTQILEYPTYVQTAVWSRSVAEGKPTNEEITFTNSDQMQVSVDVSLSYHLETVRVPDFYVKFRSDDLNNFTHGYLRNQARDAFNEHAGKYQISQIMGDNATFLKDVRDSLQALVSPIGVVIDQFGIIGAPRPPQAVVDAINAKVHATQFAQQKQNELVQVQADAAKQVAEAEGQAKATLTYAEAESTANRKLAESITPNLLELKRLEKWNGALPYINGGNSNPFVSIQGKQ